MSKGTHRLPSNDVIAPGRNLGLINTVQSPISMSSSKHANYMQGRTYADSLCIASHVFNIQSIGMLSPGENPVCGRLHVTFTVPKSKQRQFTFFDISATFRSMHDDM